MRILNLFTLIISQIVLVGCGPSGQNNQSERSSSDWRSLFDGKTLDGWEQKNGTASYNVIEGTIVGTTSEGSPNSFLCTTKAYSDFELTLEVKVDKELNSGIQIRSKTRPETIGEGNNQQKGRVFGPQVEIAEGDEEGGFSGYIWREAIGGWIGYESEPDSHKLFKGGEWNKYRILAKGPQITTWINDNMILDVTDPEIYDQFPSGFISLQVHGIREGTGPYKVAWRNIKIREL